jgi:hypothetical protein
MQFLMITWVNIYYNKAEVLSPVQLAVHVINVYSLFIIGIDTSHKSGIRE